jgi:endonuclease YncB( thermonuclease family)
METPTIKSAFSSLLAAALIALSTSSCLSDDVSGRAEVIDGDTLKINGVRVRLFGIDAAESRQRCVTEGRRLSRPGATAEENLTKLAEGTLTCSGDIYDDYGRLIAVCKNAAGIDINRQMVLTGWAWAFVKYADAYAPAEKEAQAKKLGVWSMTCETPWDFRAHRWDDAKQRAPAGCPIKGNISANGKIYHVPWERDYPKTRINPSRGERWFCSEGEAIAAGWRPPR